MAIWDIFKAKAEAERRVEGRISDLRVEKDDKGERWFIGLDSRPGEWFLFEPSPLSPNRHRGDRVAICYTGPERGEQLRSVEWITSA